jgi:hypothetical protein
MFSEKDKIDVSSLRSDVVDLLSTMMGKLTNEDTSIYGQRFVGKVESYDPDKKTDKIQVRVYGVFDGIPIDDLPWASPIDENMSGTSMILPELGSLVSVYFEQDDIYRPFYTKKVKVPVYVGDNSATASLATTGGGDDDGGVTFGDQMVLFENDSTVLQFNRADGRLSYKHASGMVINFNTDGATGTHDLGDGESELDGASIQIGLGGSNIGYSLSLHQDGAILSNGDGLGTTQIQLGIAGIKVLAQDGVLIGTETNGTSFDEMTTMRSTSPGAVVPDPANMGPYCAIPVCPMTGMPHQGNMMTVTGAPMVPSMATQEPDMPEIELDSPIF